MDSPVYFIADRLRGIPLVSGGKQSNNSTSTSKVIQVEKRNAQIEPNQKAAVLFKSGSVTASTANVIRSKPVRSTTTRKPTTTTTKVPRQNRNRSYTRNIPTTTTPPSSTTTRETRPTTTATTTAATTTTTTAKSILAKMISPNFADRSSSSVAYAATLTPTATISFNNLTRSSQPTQTTQPEYQRRTPQALSTQQQQYTNKLNSRASAGENWVVFNRPDGGISVFEVLVLVSNILIACTVLLVILINWIRSIQGRRRSSQTQPGAVVAPAATRPKVEPDPPSAASGSATPAGDKSTMRDENSVVSSNPTTLGGGDLEGSMMTPSHTKSGDSSVSKTIGEIVADPKLVSAAQNISSEVLGPMNVANKAMAIVQPTENSNSNQSETTSVEKQASGSRNESSSSEKRPADQPQAQVNQAKTDQTKSDEERRVEKLSTLFNETANANATQPEAADPKVEADKKLSTRANSLESIDLPTNLIDSIKKSETKNPTSPQAPSPNLLLADTATAATTTTAKVDQMNEIKETQAKDEQKKVAQDSSLTKKETQANVDQPKTTEAVADDQKRPENPMGRDTKKTPTTTPMAQDGPNMKDHQVVVNKLDKRKTNLEIVDVRDESVAGKMRTASSTSGSKSPAITPEDGSAAWISMDGVAVVQPATAPEILNLKQQHQQGASQQGPGGQPMSPSEIIENRFHVDYSRKKKKMSDLGDNKESLDSKQEEFIRNNIETELEMDNKMKNRKYFVYVVHDGHFTAKKECVARIELPSKRRITLAEMRTLIANSQDISVSSLRRNKFKFVTETYRLLNENEDAAVLHQVYPTQGVFLKLNIPEQENQAYPYKARSRLSSGGGGGGNQPTPGSSLATSLLGGARRRPTRARAGNSDTLPAIEVDFHGSNGPGRAVPSSSGYGRVRSSSIGKRQVNNNLGANRSNLASYRRTKSSVQAGRGARTMTQGRSQADLASQEMYDDAQLPPIDFDDLNERRRSYSGISLADMSDDKMRIITPTYYCSRASCGRLANLRCGICNKVHYCSVHCRTRDWSHHQSFCKRPRWRGGGGH